MVMWRDPWEDSRVKIPTDVQNYTIYKEEDHYIAKDGMSDKVVIEDTSLVSVLLKLARLIDIDKGTVISFKRDNYVLDSKVAFPAGVYLVGNGSTLDVTELDDFAFTFNENNNFTQVHGMLTGLEGFRFMAGTSGNSPINPSSAVAYFENIVRGVIVKDIVSYRLNGGVEVVGSCFDANIYNIKSAYSNWVIKMTTLVNGTTEYKPNQSSVRDVELSNSPSAILSGPAIYIDNNISGVNITHIRIENSQIGIENHGVNTSISDSTIEVSVVGLRDYGNFSQISNNIFTLNNSSAIGIELLAQTSYYNITNNFFKQEGTLSDVVAIKNNSGGNVYALVGANHVKFSDVSGASSFWVGSNSNGVIFNNRIIILGSGLTEYAINPYTSTCNIIGNIILTNYRGIRGGYYTVIANNLVLADDIAYNITNKTYCDQCLYTSLPDTSDTNVSKIFLNRPIHYYDGTNYYMAIWDGTTWRKTQLT